MGLLHAYIDESGDEGTGEKSSKWLVLGALIVQENEIPGAKAYLQKGVEGVWKGRKPPTHVHFQKVPTHGQRKALLHMLKGLNFTACTVAAKKRDFSGEILKGLKCPRMYNYLAKHLIERISWFGRDRNESVRLDLRFEKRIIMD